jgi:hypothetical protein
MANERRRAGVVKSQVETATCVVDRQKALGRFRTLPLSSDFEAHRMSTCALGCLPTTTYGAVACGGRHRRS